MCLAWKGYLEKDFGVIKAEHFGTISKMSNYKLDFKNGWIKESLENIDFVMSLDQRELLLIFTCNRNKNNEIQ